MGVKNSNCHTSSLCFLSTVVPEQHMSRSIIETVMRYPSGVTEAVILAELELLW